MTTKARSRGATLALDILNHGALLVVALVFLFPFFWMVSVSLKPATEPFAIPARLWPDHPTLENYATAFRPEFRTYFLNSMVVSLSTVVITVSLALLAAYTFTRTQMRLILICMSLVIAAQMFPASAIIIPIYRLMRSADLLNTYASLILAYITVTLPVAIWMLRAFMARLLPGVVAFDVGGQRRRVAVRTGTLTVTGERVTVLTGGALLDGNTEELAQRLGEEEREFAEMEREAERHFDRVYRQLARAFSRRRPGP